LIAVAAALTIIASGVAIADSTAADSAPGAAGAASPREEDRRNGLPLGLQSYEPSTFGYTKNNDDVAFYNIKLSVKFPLMPRFTERWWGEQDRLYFAFTGAFGFYIGTRDSSPVVGKEYNPQLFWEHRLHCRADPYVSNASYGDTHPDSDHPDFPCYFSFGYDHDSNGQNTSDLDQYATAVRANGTEAAKDSISRGWDYLGFTAKYLARSTDHDRLTLYPELKFFLSDGLLQGEPEELHNWETPPDAKRRKAVDGLAFLVKYQRHLNWGVIGDGKVALRYGTGYQDPFQYSTVRLEAGLQILQLPIVVWTQKGYMSDLSQYYRKVTGYGIEFEIGAF
jgi:hypothetical protein